MRRNGIRYAAVDEILNGSAIFGVEICSMTDERQRHSQSPTSDECLTICHVIRVGCLTSSNSSIFSRIFRIKLNLSDQYDAESDYSSENALANGTKNVDKLNFDPFLGQLCSTRYSTSLSYNISTSGCTINI